MLLKSQKSSVVGVDIGSHSIKLAEIDHSGKEPNLINYGITELIPGAVEGGMIVNHEAVSEAINVLFDTCQITNRQVCVALNGSDVIIKTIQTDRMSLDDLSKNINWEAEQHVPFPINEISLDYQVLDPDGTDEHMNVLLVAAKRDLIDERIGILEQAGCDVLVLDVDTFALMNALEANYDPPSEAGCYCIIHFGNNTTHLGLVKRGLPLLTRTLPLGGHKIQETVAGQLGISEDDAYLLMIGENPLADEAAEGETMPPPDITQFYPAILDDLVIGVNRAAAFLDSAAEGGTIEKIFLSGGCTQLPGLREQFESQVGLTVETVNPFSRINYKQDLFAMEPAEVVGPSLMLAIGLGLRIP